MLLQSDLCLVLLVRELRTRGAHRICASQAALTYKPLSLSGIGLVLDLVVQPGDDAIQSSSLLCVIRTGAKPWSNRDFLLGGNAGFKPVEGVGWAARCEIIAVN